MHGAVGDLPVFVFPHFFPRPAALSILSGSNCNSFLNLSEWSVLSARTWAKLRKFGNVVVPKLQICKHMAMICDYKAIMRYIIILCLPWTWAYYDIQDPFLANSPVTKYSHPPRRTSPSQPWSWWRPHLQPWNRPRCWSPQLCSRPVWSLPPWDLQRRSRWKQMNQGWNCLSVLWSGIFSSMSMHIVSSKFLHSF